MATKSRDVSIDMLRGATMLYIIFIIHGFCWLGYLAVDTIPFSIILFEMPIIFYISGVALHLSKQATFFRFLQSRILRIYLPYLIWAVSFLPCLWYMGELEAEKWHLLLAGEIKTTNLVSQMWFIRPYLLISVGGFFLYKGYQRWGNVFLLVYAVVVMGVIALLDASKCYFYGIDLFRQVLVYSLFYIFGFTYKTNLSSKVHLILLLLSLAGYLLCLIGGYSWVTQFNKFPPHLIFIYFGFLFVTLLSYSIHKVKIPYFHILSFANKYGLEMFLYQTYSFMAFRLLILPHLMDWDVWQQYLLLIAFIILTLPPCAVLANKVTTLLRKRLEIKLYNR